MNTARRIQLLVQASHRRTTLGVHGPQKEKDSPPPAPPKTNKST